MNDRPLGRRTCPECGEPVQHRPPIGWIVPAPTPQWSHLDGTPLCPVVGDHGYEPATPVAAPDEGSEAQP